MLKVKIKIDPRVEKHFSGLGPYLAKAFYDFLLDNIQMNRYGFSNSPETINRKGFNLPMIETREYIGRISVEGSKVFIRDGTHASGISFEELANILEFGRRDNGFTGFPVWRNSVEDFKEMLPEVMDKYFKQFTT